MWRSTAHVHGRFSMDFELTPLMLSSMFFWTKNSVQCLWFWRVVTNVLFDEQGRAWQSHFKNIVGCCNFTEVKSREVCTVLVDKQLFLKNRMTLPNKRSVGPSSRLKTVNLDYRSSLSVTRLVRFWFKSLQSLTAHDGQFPQGNLFLLAVCTHKVPLYLCSIFCSHSLVQVSTASYRILSHGTRPKLYP